MDYLIFFAAILGLALVLWMTFFFIDLARFGGWKTRVNVGNNTWSVRSFDDNYTYYRWNIVGKHLTDFFLINPQYKIQREFDRIELFEDPTITNPMNDQEISGTIQLGVVSGWRFKTFDYIVLNLKRCANKGVDDKGVANLILHEYTHIFLLEKNGNWDYDHVSPLFKEMQIK